MTDAPLRARDTLRPVDPTRVWRVRAGTEGVTEFLAFVVGNEHYALPLGSVREIVRVPNVTQVPRAAEDVLGILSVRGRVVTVLDLRVRLNMPVRALSRSNRILLVDAGEEILGLLVDTVLQVHRLTDEEIESSEVLGPQVGDYIVGIARPRVGHVWNAASSTVLDRKDILILLDPRALVRR